MLPRSLATLAFLSLTASFAFGQGFPPDAAVKRMKLPDGFSAHCVASEPMIRQPVSISFDARGRMWVLQYLQYPNYAGLKPIKQDQYLRTVWDKAPEPPPHGPRGADRLTILYDPDDRGVFRKSRDFVTGLNIASGFCLGNGGVYIVQPPYLLFYADKNEDDVPDGDPEVLLSGFGMDDTHSLANHLQFGPDGWLYGAAGSTSTCKVKNPAWRKGDASPQAIEFQQGIWRYHPKTRQFELFSEGGGNTYGLDFDRNGQAIAGTNWGGFAMLHQMQGAYYIKGFSKHGPLHNPHAYGYFDHVPYLGFKGGHVTNGGVVYQGDTYPKAYQDQYVAANLLSNAVYWHKLEPVGSSFQARHGGDLLEANDTWFRPLDVRQGPDGCLYVVDFYDKRAAHLDPVDNWDKTNGRIYRIEYGDGPKYPTFDLRKKTSPELAEMLKDPNVWRRRMARQSIAERRDASVFPMLREWTLREKGQLALEALWTLYAASGWMERDFDYLYTHDNEYVRAWAIRLLCDDGKVSEATIGLLEQLAKSESRPAVLAQLACSAKRLRPSECIRLIVPLIDNPAFAQDPQLPLLAWWAMEAANTWDATDTVRFPFPQNPKLKPFFIERAARRLMSGGIQRGLERIGVLYELIRDNQAEVEPFLRGIATALQGHPLDQVPPALRGPLAELRKRKPDDLLVLEVLGGMNDESARQTLRDLMANANAPEGQRIKGADLLRQVRDPKARDIFLAEFMRANSDALRTALAGLEAYDDPKLGPTVLEKYPSYTPAMKRRTIQMLVTRAAWARPLFVAVDAGTLPKAEVPIDLVRAAVALGDQEVTALVEKHYGKLAPATAGEKQARISWLNVSIGREKNVDPARGKVIFTKLCAACHQLHGEGGKVGPDLTAADRKNRGYMLAQIVDPSGYIRPEFVVQNVLTTDDRKLSGIASEAGESIVLVNVVNDQVVKTEVPKKDIADLKPSALSLMPEKLLDTLTDAQIADLFAYLASDSPRTTPIPPVPAKGGKKLSVCLVSGSFEYQSDASLAALQKYLEAEYAVTCTRAFARTDKEISGLAELDHCDVAIFFTRRLAIDGDALEPVKRYVKSGKPLIGIRTASHGFQNYLAMDKEVFGGDYQNHYGANMVCEVKVSEKQKDHPILAGCGGFRTNGSLYKNPRLAGDVAVLLTGSIPGHTEPVAWTREKEGRRVFYTSLGHPDDFKNEIFLRLLVNAVAWTTKTELKPGK